MRIYLLFVICWMSALCYSADVVVNNAEIPMCIIKDIRISADIYNDHTENDLSIIVRTLRPNNFRNDDALLDSDFTISIIDSNNVSHNAIMTDKVHIVPEGGGIALDGRINFCVSKDLVPDKAHIKFIKIGYKDEVVQCIPRIKDRK